MTAPIIRFLLFSLIVSIGHSVPAAAAALPQSAHDGTNTVAEKTASEPPPPTASRQPSDGRPIDEQLIFSVNRIAERTSDTGRAVWVITQSDLRRTNARTLPEALMEVPGLFIRQTAYGTGDPVMRGMDKQEVLILIDGIKLNNSTYGSISQPYLATIDLDMIERIEVVRGPGTVFATETMGGLINIITKKGPTGGKATPVGANAVARFSSADSGLTGRFEVFGRGDRLRYLAGVTGRNTEDVVGGGSIGRERGTGYGEAAANASLEFNPTRDQTLFLRYLRLDQHHVPRSDRILNGSSLFDEFNPGRLELTSLGYQDLTFRRWNDSLSVTGYVNRQRDDEQRISSSSPQIQRSYFDGQRVLGLNLEIASHIGTSQRIVYGTDYSHERIDSRREDVLRNTGVVTPRMGNFPDDSSYSEFGAFVKHRLTVRDRLTVLTGGRYARTSVGGLEILPIGTIDLQRQDRSLTGTVSGIFRVVPQLNVVSGFSAASRPPSLRDVSSFSDFGSSITVPSPNASAEKILATEVGLMYNASRASGSAFYYNNRVRDVLRRGPGLFNGLPFLDTNHDGTQEPDEPNIVQRLNLGRQRINGFELEGSYTLHPHVAVYGNVSHTLGDDVTVGTVPLSSVPPLFGMMGVRFTGETRRRPWGELVFQFAGKQDRLSPSDVDSSRIGPTGTPAFHVLNLRGGLTLSNRVDLTGALQNVTDEAYKYHGSGIFRPGFQVVSGLSYRLY